MMEKSKFIISAIWLLLWLVNCARRRIKHETEKSFNKKTGESVAVDNLIQKYEKEHQKFYKEETRYGAWLEWPAINSKYLSIYCRNYVQHSVPSITISNTIGNVRLIELKYEKENTSIISKVVIVQCKVRREYNLIYYITRAPEPNCVYSLKCTHNSPQKFFTIINKHCDFEDESIMKRDLKRKKEEMTFMIHRRTGQSIAKRDYLLEYELQHQKMFRKEGREGEQLKWPALNNQNLSIYCGKYLQYTVPSITINGIIGIPSGIQLHYEKENTSIINKVVMVQCKVLRKYSLNYYITRARKPNCVYSLKCTHHIPHNIFTIIHKHCDFENETLMKKVLKRKRAEMTIKIHHRTGQPIAKYKYVMEFELEHQEMFKKEEYKGKKLEWPYAMEHPNLDHYCYQYMGECADARKRNGVVGSWKTSKLYYVNFNKNVEVITVTCMPPNACKLQYHITRAPEPNCVYAILRKGFNKYSSFVIAFKHCDFEDPINQHTNSKDYNVVIKNVIPKTELKKEILDTL